MPAAWPASQPFQEPRIAGRGDRRGDPDPVEAEPTGLGLEPSGQVVVLIAMGPVSALSGPWSASESFDAEVLVDLPGRVRPVQRVEVDAPDAVVEQVAALLRRPVDADAGDRLGVVAAAVDRPQQPRREPRAEGQLGHPHHARPCDVIGMIPATIGTLIPARSQRSRKS